MSLTAINICFCLMAFAMGAIVGSFLNVVIWRLPRGEKLSYPGSHCPKCNHRIRPWENIPIISWLVLRGRCSSCHLPISWRYPAGELATGLVFFWIFFHILKTGLPLECTIGAFWLAGSLLAAAVIDAEHKFIPNKITYTGLIAALAGAILLPNGRFGLAADSSCGFLLQRIANHIHDICGLNILASPQSAAIFDCLFGAAVGFGVLGAFAFCGGLLNHSHNQMLKTPAPAVINQDGIDVPGIWQAQWEDIITSSTSAMTVNAEILKGWKQVPAGTKGPLKINVDGLSINGIKLDWDYVNKIELNVLGWSCPKSVIGYGDLKFIAMIGAFLGADAIVYILFCGSLLGVLFGLFRIICSEINREKAKAVHLPLEIPFGPFLTIPALVWIIAFA